MKKGDKVRFLSEVGGGKVAGFQGKNIVLVEDEDGFEIPMPINEVVVVEQDDYAMGKMISAKMDAKQKAEAQAQAIIDEAKAEAAEIIAKAERTIEMEQAKAIEGLHNEIAELALLAAEQIVGDKIEDAGQEAIVDRVIRNAREAEWQN